MNESLQDDQKIEQFNTIQELLDTLRKEPTKEKTGYERPVYRLPNGSEVRFYLPSEAVNNYDVIGGPVSIDTTDTAFFGKMRTPRTGATSSLYQPRSEVKNPPLRSEQNSFVVEANVVSIMNFAAALLLQSTQELPYSPQALYRSSKSITDGKPDELAIEISNMLVAMRLVGEEIIKTELGDFDPELLMVLMLTQETEFTSKIRQIFTECTEELKARQQKQKEEESGIRYSLENNEGAAMPLSSIALVHSTRTRPIFKDGKWVQPTRQSGLSTTSNRTTLHFSFNGVVANPGQNNSSWRTYDTIIITPLESMLAEHPEGIEFVSSQDTAVDFEHNEDCKFPEGTIVISSGLMQSDKYWQSIDEKTGQIQYRRHNFTSSHLQDIFTVNGERTNWPRLDDVIKEVLSTYNRYNTSIKITEILQTLYKNNEYPTAETVAESITNNINFDDNIEDSKNSLKLKKALIIAIEAQYANKARAKIVKQQLEKHQYPLFEQTTEGAKPADKNLHPSYYAMLAKNGFYGSGNHTGYGTSALDYLAHSVYDGRGDMVLHESISLDTILDKIRSIEAFWNKHETGDDPGRISIPPKGLRNAYMLGLLGITHTHKYALIREAANAAKLAIAGSLDG